MGLSLRPLCSSCRLGRIRFFCCPNPECSGGAYVGTVVIDRGRLYARRFSVDVWIWADTGGLAPGFKEYDAMPTRAFNASAFGITETGGNPNPSPRSDSAPDPRIDAMLAEIEAKGGPKA